MEEDISTIFYIDVSGRLAQFDTGYSGTFSKLFMSTVMC